MEIKQKILYILEQYLEQDEILCVEKTEDIDLVSLGIDSLKVFELILQLEECFGIEIADEDLSIENVETIGKLTRLIKKYVDNKGEVV